MKDMRGSWANRCKERAELILQIATELNIRATINLTEKYLALWDDNDYTGDYDGRHFRTNWKYGGYEEAPMPRLESFSRELLCEIKNQLEAPENALPY
jgi:hypothetical protein